MHRFRRSLTRIILSLAWLLGAGAMSLEAMLPDVHQSHQHQDDQHHAAADVNSTAAPGDAESCHCGHSHSAGLLAVHVTFTVVALPSTEAPDPGVGFHSFSPSPPRDPPRA